MIHVLRVVAVHIGDDTRIRDDGHQVGDDHVDARLLLDLACHRVGGLFARLVDAADQRPLAVVGTPAQQDTALIVAHQRGHAYQPEEIVADFLPQFQYELRGCHAITFPVPRSFAA